MNRSAVGLVVVALVGAAGAGYWLGQRGMLPIRGTVIPAASAPQSRTILYYQDPTGKPDYSPEPRKDAEGRDYVPVYEEESAASISAPADKRAKERRVLYYRNPMGHADTSPTPKKDSMGMDYIPVYDGEQDDSGIVKVSLAKVQRLGVRTEPAALRELSRTVRAVGTVQPDERRLTVVTTKFDGFIEKLLVNATGQAVRRGQPLMEIYAPELVVAQQEYLLAWRSLQDMAGAGSDVRASAGQLANAALQRLKNWDISQDQIRRLERDGTFARTLTLYAPSNGVVMEKTAVEGMRFAAGEPLYRIADLSTVWLIANVFEQDLAAIREGVAAKVSIAAYPGADFTGTVAFIYPTVARDTRTVKVRIEVPNPDGRLKIDMYANVELTAPVSAGAVVVVPAASVLNSGTRQAVLVDRGEGRFEPREVKLGAEADGFYEIREGLKAGETVVVGANFLIDAESNLRAALGAFTAPSGEAK
jgi:Cu(I)/Ag(I) efflux system membrane fusion protein